MLSSNMEKQLKSLNLIYKARGMTAVIKNIYCSFRQPEFAFQHVDQGAHNPV